MVKQYMDKPFETGLCPVILFYFWNILLINKINSNTVQSLDVIPISHTPPSTTLQRHVCEPSVNILISFRHPKITMDIPTGRGFLVIIRT